MLLVALFLLALLLGGAGFALHLLWWIAIVVVAVAIVHAVTGRG